MKTSSKRPSVSAVARERFGYRRLRPGQREAIEHVLDGRDTLVVMPTGSGKSAIYQIAGVMIEGPTVVVSPLIALQRDQVGELQQRGVGGAAEINSTLTVKARGEAMRKLGGGSLEFVFLAPEQFANEETLETLRRAKPSLFVVDEAHCISEWGHDFRPEYLRLGAVVEELGGPPVLALTATASPPVRDEIVARLGMRDPAVVVRGFDRPNIWLGVERFVTDDEKRKALLEQVASEAKPGIVYVATRRAADEVAEALATAGVSSRAYHAGMLKDEREEAQAAFMDDRVEVMVATVAFGMGVDKANVRFVFHHDISDSVDAYYQEIGRAGRDGEPARACLFYRPEDLNIHRFFAGSGRVSDDDVEAVADAVRSQDGPVEAAEIRDETGLSQAKVDAAVSRLDDAGAVEVTATGEVEATEDVDDAAARDAAEEDELHRARQRSQLEMMRGYAEVADCRREYVLNYFGEGYDDPCDNCDNCEAGRVVVEDGSDLPFERNSRVAHPEWGEGVVQRYQGDKMVVLFDSVGYKTLAVALVLENELLTPA